MKSKLLITFIFAILFLPAFTPETIAEEKSGGKIDWSGGYISAVGEGTAKPSGNRMKDELRAVRAATVLGQRALLETVKGVKIDSQKNIGTRMKQEDAVNTRITGTIQGAQIVKKDVRWEGDTPLVTVELRICLGGLGACESEKSIVQDLALDQTSVQSNAPSRRLSDIAVRQENVSPEQTGAQPGASAGKPDDSAVKSENVPNVQTSVQSDVSNRKLAKTTGQQENTPSRPTIVQADVPAPKLAKAVGKTENVPPILQDAIYDSSRPVTGIIFNLQGIAFDHVILPVIITIGDDNTSFTVYSVKSVEPQVVRNYGAVRYADSIDQARQNPFLGDNVMVVPVSGVTKENMIMIGFRNARTIRETTSYGNDYLRSAKVIIAAR